MLARKSSLGPFPRTHRLHDIVQRYLGLSMTDSDATVERLRGRLAEVNESADVVACTTLIAALPIVSRSEDPEQALQAWFGFEWRGSEEDTAAALAGGGVAAAAVAECLHRILNGPAFLQRRMNDGRWEPWRGYDGARFCELGRQWFACLLEHLLREEIPDKEAVADLRQHAWELSKITQSFSARWFQKCAAAQIPETGSIQWYQAHCIGKLDMELERELSDHKELPGNRFKRKKTEPASLGLGI